MFRGIALARERIMLLQPSTIRTHFTENEGTTVRRLLV
jgi:hypothetical protein